MGTHNQEDEQIALDAKCPSTPDMFDPNAGTYTMDAIRCAKCQSALPPVEVIPDD